MRLGYISDKAIDLLSSKAMSREFQTWTKDKQCELNVTKSDAFSTNPQTHQDQTSLLSA